MIKNPIVVTGEAPETDSEDENVNVSLERQTKRSIHGAVITGEDSESEEENGSSISSAVSALKSPTSPEADFPPKSLSKHESLLHLKLRECNILLRKDMDSFAENTVNEIRKTLSSVDQQLLQSQVVLQSAVTSLRQLSTNSSNIKNKLHSILTSKFLPNIVTQK